MADIRQRICRGFRRAFPAVLVALCFPTNVAGQDMVSLRGMVTDESELLGISLATVELSGVGAVLTADDGSFQFGSVPPGEYTLSVAAFGYAPQSHSLTLLSDLDLQIALTAAPVALDPLIVRPTYVDLRGRVRDPEASFNLVDAVILTNQGKRAETDAHGQFELSDVFEDVPVRLMVRAFGYLPLDTTVTPMTGDDRHVFELRTDPVIGRMVEATVQRLEARAALRFAPFFPNMNREELLRYSGSHTLRSLLEFRFHRFVDRIVGVVVDGKRYNMTDDPVSELSHILPEEIERLEFLYSGRSTVVLVVYTRDYMAELIAR